MLDLCGILVQMNTSIPKNDEDCTSLYPGPESLQINEDMAVRQDTKHLHRSRCPFALDAELRRSLICINHRNTTQCSTDSPVPHSDSFSKSATACFSCMCTMTEVTELNEGVLVLPTHNPEHRRSMTHPPRESTPLVTRGRCPE